jgi:DNA-binding NarL/FixJ family response regulator
MMDSGWLRMQRDMPKASGLDWTILFVDDHPIYRDGLQRALTEALPGLEVRAVDGAVAALDALERAPDVDLVLADQRLLDGDGLSLITEARRRHPAIAVALLCADVTPALAQRAGAAGAVACLSKDRDADRLAEALAVLFSGGTVFDAGLAEDGLSLRRREILAMAADGLLDKQIGDKLGISESTVRNHWQNLFLKLGAANRTEAVTRALRLGLI